MAQAKTYSRLGSDLALTRYVGTPSSVPLEVADSWGALDLAVEFAAGESIHTENSYKYRTGQAEAMLAEAMFRAEATWTDPRGWFAVCLGRAV